jgi:hypothetical protein
MKKQPKKQGASKPKPVGRKTATVTRKAPPPSLSKSLKPRKKIAVKAAA